MKCKETRPLAVIIDKIHNRLFINIETHIKSIEEKRDLSMFTALKLDRIRDELKEIWALVYIDIPREVYIEKHKPIRSNAGFGLEF